jgi:hypothetical protein
VTAAAPGGEYMKIDGVVSKALGRKPGESLNDAARRVLAAKPGTPARTMNAVRVAMALINAPAGDPWAAMRLAASMVRP